MLARVVSWLALLARSDAAKDVEILKLRHEVAAECGGVPTVDLVGGEVDCVSQLGSGLYRSPYDAADQFRAGSANVSSGLPGTLTA